MRHESTSGYEDPSLNYRVAWTIMDSGGATDERVFTSRDHGWDFYQDMRKSRQPTTPRGIISLRDRGGSGSSIRSIVSEAAMAVAGISRDE